MDVESAECWRSGGDRMVAEEGKTRATDFSIAAIMARSAAEPRSPVARSPPHTGMIGLMLTFSSKTLPQAYSSKEACLEWDFDDGLVLIRVLHFYLD